ncbi:3'-5' exonuclease [Massilia sp. NR 4-1]|uniref:3'-5' exonuclease n=1 Tax=Massilia sp. NR 4-1 TaxID=1678028 RepID=UPI0009E4B86A|nr:3'-5' exonuclease [Massilia sp. NR 4-1]
MLTLSGQRATPEQLPIISGTRMGIEIIRGAAGSGKTTTALLRLESLGHTFAARRARLGTAEPVKILVLTFNRTLAGYVEQLASTQLAGLTDISWSVQTFGAWASRHTGNPTILDDDPRADFFRTHGTGINLQPDFLLHEIDYVCGRFPTGNLDDYLTVERTGRGPTPQVAAPMRQRMLDLIRNYHSWIAARGYGDWNLLAQQMLQIDPLMYDIVIIDEAQDFSANQLRAVNHHLAEQHCVTLVMDTAQRLYPRGFTWAESGLNMTNARFHRLRTNHRNTVEIAAFAAGILDGLRVDEDGTTPDLTGATRHGALPIVCRGYYHQQVSFALDWISNNVDLRTETVAFLKPMGGGWFKTLRAALRTKGLPFTEITQERDWPQGPENIALSTMHSSKGLEFDHVIIIGLSAQNTPSEDEDDDDEFQVKRRLLAMAVARARKSVIVGYKPAEASNLVRFFVNGTFVQRDL